MKKATIMVVILFVLLGGGYLLLQTNNNAVEIAQAVIEAARAAQDAAQAAQIASRGLSTVSTIQAVILTAIIFSFLALVGAIVYLAIDKRRRDTQLLTILSQQHHRWAPGPNAGFRQADRSAALPKITDPVGQLAQLMLLQQINRLPQPNVHQLPPDATSTDPDEDEYFGTLW